MKRLAKLKGTRRSRTTVRQEREREAEMRAAMPKPGSAHQNPSHVCNVNAPWRRARAVGMNPKKHPAARRMRQNYPEVLPARRLDSAPVYREIGRIIRLLPQCAQHILKRPPRLLF